MNYKMTAEYVKENLKATHMMYFPTTCRFLEFLFGGTCEYQYNPQLQVHHYLIKNDDIGFIDMEVSNECFKNEKLNVRISRMCEEYDGYMRYKYRDYMCREQILNNIDKYVVERK